MTTNADHWDPGQYHRFKDERSRPFYDLLAGVDARFSGKTGGIAIDLGCGSGELTAALHERLKFDQTIGVDRSAAMLAKAPQGRAGLGFREGSIEDSLDSEHYDLIFSNAALHWVDGHEALFARLSESLKPGGWLAVQMPANHDHPSHLVAAKLAGEERFSAALGGYRRESPVLAPEAYSLLLHRLGFEEPMVQLNVYLHLLGSRDDVVEWVKGTLLTAYQERMTDAIFREFLARYRQALLPELDPAKPYPYAFKRVLFWARKRA